MPELGEKRRARDLGCKNRGNLTWVACPQCGREHWVQLRQDRINTCRACGRKSQQRKLLAEGNPKWKGGWHITRDGYIGVKLDIDDFFYPMMRNNVRKKDYVLEHRLVMARHVKRRLLPWEVVHHKNGIKTDNRLENLELISCSGRHNTEVNKVLKRQNKQIEQLTQLVRLLIIAGCAKEAC